MGCVGRNNSKSSSGSSGHVRTTRPGQTRKKPKDLSVVKNTKSRRTRRRCHKDVSVVKKSHELVCM